MSAKEYLNQAYRLEQRIRLARMDLEELQELSRSVGSPGFEEHFNPNHPTQAPFEQLVFRIMKMENAYKNELRLLLALKAEVSAVIDELDSQDERLVLKYRYLHNWSWGKISEELRADERTTRRWHCKALAHIKVPEHPMSIEK